MKDFGEKLSEGNKTAIEEALAKLKEVHAAKDFAGIEAASNALNTAWQNASTELYQAQQDQANGAPNAEEAPNQEAEAENPEGDVTDVEYEEVDDK